MVEKIYRVDFGISFYLKADNDVAAKVEAIEKIKDKMVHDIGFRIEKVELPDDLKELYFGEKDD